MGKTITKNQYYELCGLLALAKEHIRAIDHIKKAAHEITGEETEFGHTGDAVYTGYDVDRLLELLDITVEKENFFDAVRNDPEMSQGQKDRWLSKESE